MAAERPGSKLFSIHGQSFLVFLRGFIVYRSTVRARHLQPLGPGLCWSQHALLHENCCLVRWFAQGVMAVWSGLSSHCSLLPPKKTEAELHFLLLLWYSPILLSACLQASESTCGVFHLEEREVGRFAILLQPIFCKDHRCLGSLFIYSQMGRIHSPKKVTNKSEEWTSQIHKYS